MLKYLRIAVTALSLTACVLLIALWVRSYSRTDAIVGPIVGARRFIIHTRPDQLDVLVSNPSPVHGPIPWKISSYMNRARRTWKFNSQQYAIQLTIPMWLATLGSVTIAAISWIPWSKRFSVRTLLIATTLVAVGLGVIVATF
jgi:hypothetical protein